jgi:pimeloyl-ACP methyl ester carboxylesterase
MPLTFTKRGAGDAMVFLHGFPCTRHLWEPVIERLSQAGFSCIAPDLLGYGESPSATNVGMAAQVPHLLALLNALGLEKVELVAHDVGTAAAQLFALQHPQRLKRFVLDGRRLRDGMGDDCSREHPLLESVGGVPASAAARPSPETDS